VILSQTHIRVFEADKKNKCPQKFVLPLGDMVGIQISEFSDGVIIISTPGTKVAKEEKLKGDKGDMIFDTPHVIEFATYILHTLCVKPGPQSPLGEQSLNITSAVSEKLKIAKTLAPILKDGKPGKILFAVGEPEYSVVKDEGKKALLVTAPETKDTAGFMRSVRSSLRLRASPAP
jgi:hypothetical protein